MILFEINFNYNNKEYLATAHKIHGNPVQYLISGFVPNEFQISIPFILVCNNDKETLEYSATHDYPDLGHTLAVSIFDACRREEIEVFK